MNSTISIEAIPNVELTYKDIIAADGSYSTLEFTAFTN
jgi:hypothetical protein